MKPNSISLLLIPAAALTAPLLAQEPPPATPPVVVEKTTTETVSPGQRVVEETVVEKRAPAFDPRRQLEIVPRAIPVPPVAPQRTETTQTETTTTTARGGRVYNTERSVVVVEGRELPYVTIPVLFVKETAELLDAESRDALDKTAAAILEVLKTDSNAQFDIEGHTSTDGSDELNLQLSADRAKRVYDELTLRYKISPAVLSAHGYGENYPMYPNGSEAQMTYDRRVLVVRSR